MCHATLAGRKAGSVSTNKSQIVDTLSTNKAYLLYLTHQDQNGAFQQSDKNCAIKFYDQLQLLLVNKKT